MSYEVKEIIRKIKDKREEIGLSYKELEKKTGISASTLYRYETMETNIPLDKFQIICNVLNLKADELLGNGKEQVKTAARDKKVFDKYSKLDEAKRKIVEALIDSYFDENVEDEED